MKLRVLSASLGLLTLVSCTRRFSTGPEGQVRPLTAEEQAAVRNSNDFGLRLFQEVVRSEGSRGNVFVSPYSVSAALAMVANGASGATREEMWTALGFADLGMEEADAAFKGLTDLLLSLDPKVQLEIANAIWYRLGLHVRSDFVRLVRDYFGAPVSGLDFASPRSVQVVNQWASERTHGKIPKVLDSINPLDVMFLANAIYFKGLWTYRFEESQTQEDVFHLPGGSTIPCRMMLQTVDDLPYQRRANLAAVDLPYGSGHFSMTILLPEPGIDVDSLLLQISSPELQSLFSGFEKRKVTIWLPKFRIRYGKELSPELKRLGMQTAFDPDRADFSRLFEDQLQPYISSVLHRSYVQVDEAGTEAAAVTVVIVGVTSVGGGENAVLFRVDRPFIFLIRERDSGALLFAGRITEPQWEE